MRCNGFKHENFLVKQKCKELLAFTFLEVRFLVDLLQQQKKAYKRHSDGTVFLWLDPALE